MTLEPPTFPAPVTEECIRAKNKGDEEKMAQALNRLHEEDPTFGRAYETKGETKMAIEEYGRFPDLWKNADFKSEEIQDVKNRLARLMKVGVS